MRPVGPGDRNSWTLLWADYNAFYGRVGPTALAPAITAKTWASFFDPDAGVRALVALRNERPVGFAHYLFHPSTSSCSKACYLQDLFVAESARGMGFGKLLIEKSLDDAVAAGAAGIYWLTHKDNATAIGLYDRIAQRSAFVLYRKTS